MEFKDFQQRVLDVFDAFLDELAKQQIRADGIAKLAIEQPELNLLVPDSAADAWGVLHAKGRLPSARAALGYSRRLDGTDQSVPNVCLKIPTGGGKTLLATAAISRIFGRVLERNTGFVLWIVPNEAIYTQTRKQLVDRDHPYRQMLDRSAAGRVKILKKEDRLNRRDVETHLCVMLLMLQSANRETKATLRMFRDRGNVRGFFPAPDDIVKHQELLAEVPNLTAYADDTPQQLGSIVHDSLGNVLRYLRPVIVMDEGHKAYSPLAISTLYGFNPCFLLELSATPKDRAPLHANWLVDVHGTDLAAEEMIKLPINVRVKGGTDWHDCLRDGLKTLDGLLSKAQTLQANTGRYVRPIMLVQVERTGRDKRDGSHIHADDVKDYLLKVGLTDREIAIKTSEVNDLKQPENLELLSPISVVRVIITKQALQEGWDCPFAYVLCSLAASKNMGAMTQLVGRILRQPHASKTGIAELDECYVICFHQNTKDVVQGIKLGLEQDGMADLAVDIKDNTNSSGSETTRRSLARRREFKSAKIYLPVVNWVTGKDVRALDYDRDILMQIDWGGIDVSSLAARVPTEAHKARTRSTRLTIAGTTHDDLLESELTWSAQERSRFDPVFATRVISDIVPNPWVGRDLVGKLISLLKQRGFTDSTLGAMSGYILEELRGFLTIDRDQLAESLFVSLVTAGKIQFCLRTDRHNWRMPDAIETDRPTTSTPLVRPSDGHLTERSVFAPVYRDDFNGDEAEFACYLDEQGALQWWHRNVAKAGGYSLQGWRRHRVYPDFVFALQKSRKKVRLVVWETKGDQLEGNLDTVYKRKLMQMMSANYRYMKVKTAGKLQIVIDSQTTVTCDLVLMSDWKTRAPIVLSGADVSRRSAN
jgi:type III restriction enzyme